MKADVARGFVDTRWSPAPRKAGKSRLDLWGAGLQCGRVKSRIMYIEDKSGGLVGAARIGRVTFSKTGRTIYYRGKEFRSLKGGGFKANYYEVASGDCFWITGPKRDGRDALYATHVAPQIDADVREEYWREIRGRSQGTPV